MKLNKSVIKTVKQSSNAKTKLTREDDNLIRELLVVGSDEFNFVKDNVSMYEACLMLESKENSKGNKGKRHRAKFNEGSIVMVDLGINVYGHEFSYEHPCIVIINKLEKVFVVPCTSQPAKRNSVGKVYPEYVEGFISDGFKKDTTILIGEAKFIDKTRIKSQLGILGKDRFKEIQNKLFRILLPYKEYALTKVKKDLVTLETENNILISEKDILTVEKNKIQEELNNVKSRLTIISNIIYSDDKKQEFNDIKKILDECV